MNLDTIHKRISDAQEQIYKREKAAGTPITKAQARVMAWKENPTLKELSRTADPAPVKEAGDDRTRIAKAIEARMQALAAVNPELWRMSGAQVRVQIRKTPDGAALTELDRDLQKHLRNPERIREIRKGSKHAKAWATLRRWEADPSDGIR